MENTDKRGSHCAVLPHMNSTDTPFHIYLMTSRSSAVETSFPDSLTLINSSASSSFTVVLASKGANSYLILLILLSRLPILSRLIALYIFDLKWYFVKT